VAASILSQAGYSVLIVEKGPYLSRLNTSQLEGDAYDQIYENHALQTTADGNIMIFAGSTLGGGSAINYACCIELPDDVRLEWAELGLKHCHPNSSEFNCSQEAVLNRIGAIRSDNIHHNGMNAKLIQGSKALNHKYTETKQNLKDTKHDSAGYTCFGDRYGNKQGMTQTFLQDAVEHGCKILENAFVERISYQRMAEGVDNIHLAGARKATGVLVRHNGQLLTIKASRCVICAAGALNTPCLLTRSGFKNPHIGKHLHLHPVTTVS
jgi:choline dehydrogenase-like flavoprotein